MSESSPARARAALVALALAAAPPALASDARPVYVGLDLEFGHRSSTSAPAIRRGVLVAVDEINAAGGVLGGRPLRIIERDNRSVPARGVENLRELAAIPDLVAVFCGKFAPVAMEQLPLAHALRIPLLAPWAAADTIVENGYAPNYVFRVALVDGVAMPAMLDHAERRGHRQVGLLLANTSWGRSNEHAARAYLARHPRTTVVGTRWYNLGESSLLGHYEVLRRAGATAIVTAIIDPEAATLVKEVATLPARERLPIVAHQGIVGSDLPAMTGLDALGKVDLTILQPFSFAGTRRPAAARVLSAAERLFGISDLRDLTSPGGTATAYDLTHLLALAIDQAGSTDRAAIRDALERLPRHEGLVKTYAPAFTPARHEGLGAQDVIFTRFDGRGVLVPAPGDR